MTVTRLWVDGVTLEITGPGDGAGAAFRVDGRAVDLRDHPGATRALWVGVLNNDARLERCETGHGRTGFRIVGDPTEGSILAAAAGAGVWQDEVAGTYPRVREIPFDSTRRRMMTVHAVAAAGDAVAAAGFHDRYVVAVKGAVDVVLGLCTRYQTAGDGTAPLDDAARGRVREANDAMTGEALRVLGVAYRRVPALPATLACDELETDLVFVGLIGMSDPARAEVRAALETARRAGIRTIMITGDYANTARAVAQSIDLLTPGHQILTGAQITAMDDAALRTAVRRTDVFARVSPEHKLRIVDALRAGGEVVAMTGDGVNDAPAIRRADIGVAMGITGTDVAKQTADMVLTDDNYASIVAAIEQGRVIYSNIRKFVFYLLSCNVAEIAVIALATAVTGRSPLTPLQLLWLNLITDGAPALALGSERGDPGIMAQPPRPAGTPVIDRVMRVAIAVQTVAITTVTLLAWRIGAGDPTHGDAAATMAFVTLSLSELLRAYTARSESRSLLAVGIFGNRWMNLAVLGSLALVLVVVYVPFLRGVFRTQPLDWAQWATILPLLVVPAVVAEGTKAFFRPRVRAARIA